MPYDPLFARYYDYIVHGRREALATEADLSFLEDAFARRTTPVEDVLDAGCGAGRYAVPLALAGYTLTGIDNSSEMLAQCRSRLEARCLEARLVEMDLLLIGERAAYDAALCMNSVICYFLQTEDIVRALSVLFEALRPGGLLVLEMWNVLAHTASFGSTGAYELRDGDIEITNAETSSYDSFGSIYRARLDVTVLDSGERHSFSWDEVLRVMTVGELTGYLREAGFADISAHLRPDTLEPDSGDEEIVFLATRPL